MTLNTYIGFNFCLLHPVLQSSQINVYAIQMFVTIYLTNLKPVCEEVSTPHDSESCLTMFSSNNFKFFLFDIVAEEF